MAKLVFLDGRRMGNSVSLASTVSIGRAPDNTVILHESGVLDHHAVIKLVDGAYRIAKADPLARLAVNGRRPVEGEALKHGDTLSVGPLSFSFTDEAETRPRAQPVEPTAELAARAPQPAEMDAALDEVRRGPRALEACAALCWLGTSLHASLRQSEVIDRLLDGIFRLFTPERAFVLLRDDQGNLQVRGERGRSGVRIPRAVLHDALESRSAILARIGPAGALVAPIAQGAIYLDAEESRPPYQAEDLPLLNAAALQASVALENARALDREATTGRTLQRLSEAGRRVGASLLQDVVLKEAVEQGCRLFDCSKASLLLLDPTGQFLTVAASNCIERSVWPSVKIRPGEGFAGRVLKEGRPLLVTDAPGTRAYETASFAIAPVAAEPGAPLRGVVSVTDKAAKGAFTPDDLQVLSLFAAQIATAVANTRLYEHATVDPLTRLYNPHFFQAHLSQEVAAHLANGAHLSLFIVDLDHLKDKNDVYGAPVGDRLIAEAAGLLRKQVGPAGFCARSGGDEFAAVLPGTALERAHDLAKDVRLEVEKFEFNAPEEPLHATVSIGVTALTPGDTSERILKRVESALQAAKRGGRNRVEAAR